ncbi:MAG: hypothetical protein FJ224_00780 [Lentisphaerae bacterium]|nr:hypothetical protein [Lentisphaerota bacterium]
MTDQCCCRCSGDDCGGSHDPGFARGLPRSLRRRLLALIDAGDPYFILTGSDPSEMGGCCPSGDVAAANQLVKAGVLESLSPPAGGRSCPTSIYAFKGEIDSSGPEPAFTINSSLRAQARADILAADSAEQSPLRKGFRWGFMALVAATAAAAIAVSVLESRRPRPADAVGEAARAIGNGTLVCLFKASEPCRSCEVLRRRTRSAVESAFESRLSAGSLRVVEVEFDDPSAVRLRRETSIYTATLLVAAVSNGIVTGRTVVEEAWDEPDSDETFAAMLREKILSFENNRAH